MRCEGNRSAGRAGCSNSTPIHTIDAQVEEGLSRLLSFLREEEERERLEEVERLKPIGTPVCGRAWACLEGTPAPQKGIACTVYSCIILFMPEVLQPAPRGCRVWANAYERQHDTDHLQRCHQRVGQSSFDSTFLLLHCTASASPSPLGFKEVYLFSRVSILACCACALAGAYACPVHAN